MSEVKTEQAPVTKVKITPAEVIKMLNEGKTRKEIGQHFGLNRTNTMNLFSDPRLKGRKTKNAGGTVFELEDDGTEPLASKAKAKSNGSSIPADEVAADGTVKDAIAPTPRAEAPVSVPADKW